MDTQTTMLWKEVSRRVASGENQAAIAKELNLSRGQFRYRLRKFLELSGSSNLEVATTTEHAGTPIDAAENTERLGENTERELERSQSPEDSITEMPSTPLFGASLFDESWRRQWGISRLVALVKEDTTVFVYWEVDDVKRNLVTRHFHSDWANLPFFLQVYDVTDIIFNGHNAHSTTRIDVHPGADNWYIHSVGPRRSYVIDFGTTTWDGRFFTILRSNIIETPPERSHRAYSQNIHFGPVRKSTVISDPTPTERQGQSRAESWTNESQHAEQQSDYATETHKQTESSTYHSDVETPYAHEFDGYSVRTGGGN